MLLNSLNILNFKNISESSLELSEGVNCFVGSNGMGKSNILEAVYYLSMARSFRAIPDAELLRYGTTEMMVQGRYNTTATDGTPRLEVSIGYRRGSRKVLRRDGKECRRFSDHIGTVPIVIAAPSDNTIITGMPEERRRLIDSVISQANPLYLRALIRYNEALSQRNAMLKSGISDPLLTESVEAVMVESAQTICRLRAEWIADISTPFSSLYGLIAGEGEQASLQYKNSVEADSFALSLARSRAKDSIVGFTTVGPHRDDIELLLNDHSMRRSASQGQMKSYTVALRLAVFHFLRQRTSTLPLLLLDDIFDKLDASRVENIVRTISSDNHNYGQIFITDTNRTHIDSILRSTAGSYSLFAVEDGNYSLLASQ